MINLNRLFTAHLWQLFLTISITVLFGCLPAFCATDSHPASKPLLQGNLVENQVMDELERVGIKCGIQEGKAPYAFVSSVRSGSAALYAGIAENDKIISIKPMDTKLEIMIERGGHQYQCVVDSSTHLSGQAVDQFFKLIAQTSGKKVDLRKEFPVKGTGIPVVPATNSQWPVVDVKNPQNKEILLANRTPTIANPEPKWPVIDVHNPKVSEVPISGEAAVDTILKRCNIELIIDISGSMQEHDGTGDLSKFEWCHEQVRDLAQRLSKLSKRLNITTFNATFDTYLDCDPSRVEQIYGTTRPAGFTDMVDPLIARLNVAYENEAARKETTVIAIITDGMPNVPRDPVAVNQALINFTQKLRTADDVKLTFLQIGDTFDGRDFCIDLDQNLVNEGAKFDIVDTKTFPELKQIGLAHAIADALHAETGVAAGPSPDLLRAVQSTPGRASRASVFYPAAGIRRDDDGKIKIIRDERHDLEQQLLK